MLHELVCSCCMLHVRKPIMDRPLTRVLSSVPSPPLYLLAQFSILACFPLLDMAWGYSLLPYKAPAHSMSGREGAQTKWTDGGLWMCTSGCFSVHCANFLFVDSIFLCRLNCGGFFSIVDCTSLYELHFTFSIADWTDGRGRTAPRKEEPFYSLHY